mgnify:FL=1
MGLDMYLTAEKRLNKNSKVDKQLIEYFDSIDFNEYGADSDGSIYISEYFTSKAIYDTLSTMPKLYGQVGRIKTIVPDGDSYIVRTEAGYWRKANQIHGWFVNKCQDGIDDCQLTQLEPEQLTELFNLVSSFGIIPSFRFNKPFIPTPAQMRLARELLPSESGFFFGSTEYDEGYFYDIRETRDILKKVLKPSTINNWKISYQSSW